MLLKYCSLILIWKVNASFILQKYLLRKKNLHFIKTFFSKVCIKKFLMEKKLSEPLISSIPLIYVEQLSPTYTHTNTMVTLISLHHTKVNAVYLVFRAS